MVVMGRSQLKLFCISFFGGGVFMLWLGLWEFSWFGICSSTFSSEGEGFFSLHGGKKEELLWKYL
jgi:hypothetical protein